MGYLRRLGFVLLVLFSGRVAICAEKSASALPVVMANDNGVAAGQVRDGVLELRLELCQGRWYPEDETGAYRDVYAFAEQGRAPLSSGPLLRVVEGTRIHAAIHNALPVAARVYGLHRHPGDAKDALTLAPDETREVQFVAGEPGTYLYWATTADKTGQFGKVPENLLSAAFVVDAPGGKTDDRIFVIGIWSKVITPEIIEEIESINGRSWPYTERLTLKLGETVHWRVINASASAHAMHLHGFYFAVDVEGDGERYETHSSTQRLHAVTERIDVGRVFDMTWTAEREGNWLFHCHMMAHMAPSEALARKDGLTAADSPRSTSSSSSLSSLSLHHDKGLGMGGLVIGITVLPGATPLPVAAAATGARKLQLAISDNPGKIPLYNLEVNDPLKPTEGDKKTPSRLLGPPIVLTRGEAAEIEVKNQSSNPTVIHWHGIEVENYYDGVDGWTGGGGQTTPPIAPGTSFVARMTPPRAGTFIYHTHWHDGVQLRNGVYGPLIVLEPGQKYDPEHDRTFVFSIGKYDPFGFLLLVNGSLQPSPVELHTSTPYRLRLINITSNSVDLRVRLSDKGTPVKWKVVAKDGADLPAVQSKSSDAEMGITVGETYDVEYRSDAVGQADMVVWDPLFYPPVTMRLQFVDAKAEVK